MGEHIQIRTKAPYRAAMMELQPGLYVVGELRADAMDFGASSAAVTREIFKAVDKGLDTVFPKRKAKKAQASAEAQRIRDARQQEQELRTREARLRDAETRLCQLEAKQRQPKRRRPSLKREAARWLVNNSDWDEDLLGADTDEPYSLRRAMWELHQDDE